MVHTFEKVRRRTKEQFIFCLKLLPPLLTSVVKQRFYLRKQMLEAHLNLNQSMSPNKQGLVDGEPQRADDDDRLVAQDVCDQEHDQSLDYTGVDGHRVYILRHLDRQQQLQFYKTILWHVVFLRVDVGWPVRWTDLNTSDLFLWSYLK